MEEKIGNIIGRVIEGHTDRLHQQPVRGGIDIESVWFKVVDERIKAHTYVERLRRGILYVRVNSSCYLAEMRMKKKTLLSLLKTAGWGEIQDIEFRM